MTRPSRVRIDLDALRRNYASAKALHGGRVLAVLKADAYGHGAVACARALADGADGFAVAFMEEALELRRAGIAEPILALEGAFDANDLDAAAQHRIWLVVHQERQLAMAEHAGGPSGLTVWLKADSGMGRAGFPLAELGGAYRRLAASGRVDGIVLMTHFARADEPDARATADQVAAFDRACAGLDAPRSLANSAGILQWPSARHAWGRAGILLYGADPMPAGAPKAASLRPVMTLESEVFAVRSLPAGAPVGYGGGFVTRRPTRVGLVAIGYADGYPRVAPAGTPVAVDGRRAALIGRVSMDMLTVDLTDLPEAGIGSRVELWGRQVDVNAVAVAAGTIAYELLCNVKRVPRVYEEAGKAAAPAA
jgi:alanine racemase